MGLSSTRVLVLGAGSIGSRHARNLKAAGAEVSITDPDSDRARAVPDTRFVPYDLGMLHGFDGIVVASPTVHHRVQAEAALAADARILVEKPLALPTDTIDTLLAADDRVMVGYNLRFHEPLVQLMQYVVEGRVGRVCAVRVWFGQWLPDWRPNVDYRSTYSAQAALGGGVLLDAIHELDMLVWVMGDGAFDVLGAFVGRVGPLDIDVEDTVRAVLRHQTGAVAELSLDYLSRRYRRGIEVIGADATARFDWARATIEIESGDSLQSEPAAVPLQHSYEREAVHFLAFVRGEATAPVNASVGAASLELARRVYSAA